MGKPVSVVLLMFRKTAQKSLYSGVFSRYDASPSASSGEVASAAAHET